MRYIYIYTQLYSVYSACYRQLVKGILPIKRTWSSANRADSIGSLGTGWFLFRIGGWWICGNKNFTPPKKSRLFVAKSDPFSKAKVTPCSTPQRWLCGTPEVGSRHFFGGNRVGLKGNTPWEPEISEVGQVDDIPMIPHICLPMSHAYVGCLMTTVEMIDVWWMTQVVISSGWKSW